MYPVTLVARSSLFPCQHVANVLARSGVGVRIDEDGIHFDPSDAMQIDQINRDNALGLPSMQSMIIVWSMNHPVR